MKDEMTPHWIVIVRRDRPEIVPRLKQSYRTSSLVEILVDRRLGERRRALAGASPERRGGDRRRTSASRTQTTGASHRLVQQTPAYDVYEAESVVVAACPKCEGQLEFEMPRFGELPAQIDLNVLHAASQAHGAKHFVEAEAFRATGRSILACRLLARLVSSTARRVEEILIQDMAAVAGGR